MDGYNCRKWDDSWKTCTDSSKWLSWEKYMILDDISGLWKFWGVNQYFDPTYEIWRSWDSKWTGDCMGRKICFTCNNSYVFDLEQATWVQNWNISKHYITGAQYSIKAIWRESNFYINPYSSEVIELGTQKYPYKTMRAAFSEILNNFSHSSSNLTIYLKENAQIFTNDNTNYIINMTSVTIKSYSDTSNLPGKAILIPTQIELPTTSDKTLFHILDNLNLNLNEVIQAGSLSSYEVGLITTIKSTFSVTRTNFSMNNIIALRQPEDNIIRWFFLFFVYLQDRVFDIRNTDFNITGIAFRTYDPLNIYMENLYVDTHALRSFWSFKAACNYPEAQLTGYMNVNNITVITTSERPFDEDPAIVYYYDATIW